MSWAAVIGAGGALIGGAMSSKGAKDAAKSQNDANAQANKPDPRVDNMLWGQPTRSLKSGVTPTYEMVEGDDGRPRRVQTNPDTDFEMSEGGLMNQYRDFMKAPQSEAMKNFGNASGDYLTQNGAADMTAMRDASMGLMGNMSAPQAQAALGAMPSMTSAASTGAAQAGAPAQVAAHSAPVLWNKGETFSAPNPMQAASVNTPAGMQAAYSQSATVNAPQAMSTAMANASQVNAPRQNGMDLTGSYDSLVNGDAGNNPYLTGAIGRGINQSSNAFGAMQRDSTQNLLENVLPSIRGGAVIAGGYGSSRQGIAEGRALDTFGREQQRAMSQFGQNNTDAAVTAQAGAYDADRNRQLSATQGLGAQQYGVASQNSAQSQQANLTNAAARNTTNQTNYQGGLAASMANAGYQQQSNLANQASNNNANQTNYQGLLGSAMANAGYQQQANSNNYAGQLQTNQQNASNLQQANLANQNAGNAASMFGASAANAASQANAQMGMNNNQYNAGLQQQTGQFNAGLQQQTGQFNAGLAQQMSLANLGNQQQTNLSNMQSQLGTNQLNTNRTQSGMAGLSGLLGTAYQNAGNQDNWAINRATQVNGLLQPYLSKNPMPQTPQVFSNSAGAGIGGAMMGMQLGQGLMSMFGKSGTSGMGGGVGGAGSGMSSVYPPGGY